ncbi:MAG: hypothetical protein JRD68_15285 [Deltaproteobacteria bacterium]|nr:hypothetical protein [Deltaproteobacteria bacterium]
MDSDLEIILNNLKKIMDADRPTVEPPPLYLDQEGVLYLFQSLTGLNRLPLIDFDYAQGGAPGISLEHSSGLEPPMHLVYQAVLPILRKKTPLVSKEADLAGMAHKYAQIRGVLSGTRFPDGRSNLEIRFADVRCLLFYTRENFSSMLQPLLQHDRYFTLECQVEALVYLQGPVQKSIFYHQTYGDDKEHTWLPLVPVVIKSDLNTQRL